MQLEKYRVTNFRSVEDSGWIECDRKTTLVGINESGKSNLLLALWKLNPVNGGKIDVLHDLPATSLAELRDQEGSTAFIEAEFALEGSDVKELKAEISDEIPIRENDKVTIKRFYDGNYVFEYGQELTEYASKSLEEEQNGEQTEVKAQNLQKQQNKKTLQQRINDVVQNLMPNFIYYSNYGNLASRIYLPNVIKLLNNKPVEGATETEEQLRTIQVLFDFVNLKPQEIYELGQEKAGSNQQPVTKNVIETESNEKEKRWLLLQSAAAKLTECFNDWWKQGKYHFGLNADGNYFSITVSDDKRPEEVDLSLRSTGLQWFLSFFLVFIVESQKNHKNAVLLLDEAGLTLHPNAQKDLTRFFDSLSNDNQIILTTHSPFIVDTDSVDACRVVYRDEEGKTVASSDLKSSSRKDEKDSIYPIFSALGLNVSDILLMGCQPVIVEGVSDQYYLSAIKNILIKHQKIQPQREMVFVPSGGVKNIAMVASILSGRTDFLPIVVMDSDESGNNFVKKLKSQLYREDSERIIQFKDIVGFDGAEVEDLISHDHLDDMVSILTRGAVDEFMSEQERPYLPQFESYAKNNRIQLSTGWKVDMARKFKQTSLGPRFEPSGKELEIWKKLFDAIIAKS